MKKNGVMLVGLCGRSGAGKGYIGKMFAELGIPSIDTDAVYRQMTSPVSCRGELSPCMLELVERFGERVLAPDLSLDRVVMRGIVFGEGSDEARGDLNRITHRYILAETEHLAHQLYEDGSPIVLIDAPVLFESGFDRLCECVVCVSAPEETLVRRICRRDGLSEEDARLRLSGQRSHEELEGRADFVIMNDDERPILYERVGRCAAGLRAIYEKNYVVGDDDGVLSGECG